MKDGVLCMKYDGAVLCMRYEVLRMKYHVCVCADMTSFA